MSIAPAFGRMLVPSAVSLAVKSHLEQWLVPFLAEVERQLEIPPRTIAQPSSWEIVSSLRKFDGSRLPCVVIGVDEIGSDPTRNGDGSFDAVFPVGIAVVVGGRTPAETERNAMAYGAAVRGAMSYIFDWERKLGAVGTRWVGDSYTDMDETDRRTKAAAMVLFDIKVENVARDYVGAPMGTTPPADPYAVPPALNTVQSVITTVEPS